MTMTISPLAFNRISIGRWAGAQISGRALAWHERPRKISPPTTERIETLCQWLNNEAARMNSRIARLDYLVRALSERLEREAAGVVTAKGVAEISAWLANELDRDAVATKAEVRT